MRGVDAVVIAGFSLMTMLLILLAGIVLTVDLALKTYL